MRQQKIFEYSDTNMCPVCNSAEENITHMIRCQIITNPEWTRDLQIALKNVGFERQVRALMAYGIWAWADGEDTPTEDHPEVEKDVFYNQGKIGWNHFLRG